MNDATGPGLTDELLEDCLQAVHRTVTQGREAAVGEIAAFAHVSPTEVGAAISLPISPTASSSRARGRDWPRASCDGTGCRSGS
jgi:hypothetical protein